MPTTRIASSKIRLIHLSERETKGTEHFEHASEELVDSLLHNGSFIVGCPMVDARGSTSICEKCPHFMGLGVLETAGKEPPIERKYRVMCNFPIKRTLYPVSMKLPSEVKAHLEDSFNKRCDPSTPAGVMEKELLVDNPHMVNCPISRNHSEARVWEVVCPPCLDCQHYQGCAIKQNRKGEDVPCVRCACPNSLSVDRVNIAPQLQTFMDKSKDLGRGN